ELLGSHSPYTLLDRSQIFDCVNLAPYNRATWRSQSNFPSLTRSKPSQANASIIMSTYPKLKVIYFPMAGRAEAIRLALHIGGIPFEDQRVPFPDFASTVKPAMPFGQVPVVEVNGEPMAQSQALLRYVGRLANLYPANNPLAALKIDEVMAANDELGEQLMPSFREQDPEKKMAMRKELAEVTLPRYLKRIEARLSKLEAELGQEQLFIHHLYLYQMMEWFRGGTIDHIPITIFDDYKQWTAIHDRVTKHPKVVEWYAALKKNTKPTLKLTYFPAPGRAEPIRLAFHIGGIAFEDERISYEQLQSRKPSLPFEQLPVLEVNGEIISQSLPLLRYAGTLAALYPANDPLAALRVDEVFGAVDDLSSAWSPSFREQDEVKKMAMRKELAEVTIPKHLSALDRRVSHWNAAFATGDQLTVADLVIYSTFVMLKSGRMDGVPTSIVDAFSHLMRVYNKVHDHPKVFPLKPTETKSRVNMSTYPKIKVTYFPMAGRAESIRLVLHVGGIPFIDERVSHEEFGAMKPALPYGQVPVVEVDGEVLAQTQGILRYVGRLAKMYPANDPLKGLKIDEILAANDEFAEQLFPSLREKDPEKKLAMRKELAATTIPRYLKRIEARLVKLEAELGQEQLFIHHFAIHSMVEWLRSGHLDHIPATITDDYKLYTSIHDRVAKHPKVVEWYAALKNSTKPNLKLTYFPSPGRAEPIRLAFHIAGIAFEDERINYEQLAARKPSLPFEQLPVLEVNGEVISQSFPLLRYAGTLAGLYPVNDPLAALRVDEVFGVVDELNSAWGPSFREQDETKKMAMRKELAEATIPKHLSALDKRVGHWNTAFAAGCKLTVADLAIYGTFVMLKSGRMDGVPTSIVDAFSHLMRVYNKVHDHPKVVEWNKAHSS
ncbi:TPA: hypothetical protein N0F65_010979, partial [Lagenidium giganteum]